MNIPDGYEYYENKAQGCFVNAIYRIAELGAICVIGLLIIASIFIFSFENILDFVATIINISFALLFFCGTPILLVFFVIARLREWKAERDYKRNNADRQIARENAIEFAIFTYGDENMPHREIERDDN